MKRKSVITSFFLAGALVAGGLSFALASVSPTPKKTEATYTQTAAEYYSGFNWDLTGSSLKTALFNKINLNTLGAGWSYDGLFTAYQTTDTRSNGTVWDLYSDKTTYTHSSSHNYSKEGDGFNREHMIPQSIFNEAAPMKSDIHHVFPTDGYVNNRRSNYPHGNVNKSTTYTSNDGYKLGYTNDGGYSGLVFEVKDEYKGDVARTYFYFVTCYQDKLTSSSWKNFDAFTKNTYPSIADPFLDIYLQWAKDDPVSQKEIDRNNAAYAGQGNRNPFIDCPYATGAIWDSSHATDYGNKGEIIVAPQGSTGITSISKTTASIVNGNSTTISATSSNSGTISWSSSNTNVATVSNPTAASGSNITINAVGVGTSTITASITINGTTYSKTCTVTVTAPKTLSSISVSGQKTTFTVNEAFSFGGTVTAHYTDSTTANVTESATFTGYDMATLGNQTVTVSYTEGTTKTTSYSITINEASASESITITYSDLPTSYSSSETALTTAGKTMIKICNVANYSSNIQVKSSTGYLYNSSALTNIKTITMVKTSSGKNVTTVYGGASSKSTTRTFTASQSGNTYTYDFSSYSYPYFYITSGSNASNFDSITIEYGTATTKTLSSVATSGQKTSFSTGENFSYGGTLTATYSDSSHAGVTPTSFKYGASGINPTSAGTAITTSTVMSASTHNGKTIYVLYTEGGVTKYASYTISVSDVSVTSVSLNSSSESINVGGTVTLTATVLPSNATNKNVSWSSSNTSVATVSGGTVTGVAKGTATITVTTQDGSKTDTCTITVLQQVTGVSLDKPSLSLTTGNTGSLVATVTPSNASNKNVTWSTSNSSVAAVSNGTVTAVAAGTATITVETEDGGFTDECSVTVTDPIVHVTGVSLNYTTKSVDINGYFELEATIAPSNATYKSVSWSSSNDEVATVSAGLVRGISAGTATITVTTVDGGHTATCTVTVTSSGSSSETQATIDLSAQGFTNEQEVTSVSSSTGSAQVVFDKGTNNNVPKYFDTGTAVRVYSGGTFTVSSSMYTITSITITFGSGDKTNEITCNVGTLSLPTWTGSSDSVTFTVGGTKDHRRIKSLNITFENSGGTDPDPTPTPSNTSFKIIESQAEIMDGTQLVIGYINGNTVKVMKNYESGKYYHYTVDGIYSSETGTLTPNEGYSRWTIGDTESGYTFKNANNQYLNANSESYSNLVATSSLEATTYWEITIESDSYHTIRNLNNSSRSWVCYASGYTNFDCEANEVTPGILMFADVAATTKAFVDNYLHMSDYTSNLGWCKDQEHGYYEVAKERLLAMGSAYIYEFQENDAFNAAQARYEAWASFNGDITPYYDSGSNSASLTHASTNNVVTTITVLTLCTLSISAIYLALKHRKFERKLT